MSERALAYSEEPLRHRFMVVYEAAGMTGDFASYLMRSLLSEGRIRYETVEKTKDGLRARLIEREGPTGLLVTTTQTRLHPENETRLLSIPVTDTPEQTRLVFQAIARGDGDGGFDPDPWHALQVWLAHAEHRVVIPYAKLLGKLIPPIAVRLRRDFGMLLNLTSTYALLHQASRDRDGEGRIVASLEDYAQVRALIADLIAEGIEANVPATVRETVRAAKQAILLKGQNAEEVTIATIAKHLELDKSAAWRRVQQAIDLGYLENRETGRGRPARIAVGDSLPRDREVLPASRRCGRRSSKTGKGQGCTVAGVIRDIPPPPPLLLRLDRPTRRPPTSACEVNCERTRHAGRGRGIPPRTPPQPCNPAPPTPAARHPARARCGAAKGAGPAAVRGTDRRPR
jgi:hypothetical protein